MTAPRNIQTAENITRAAQWLADQRQVPAQVAVVVAGRFNLSPEDAVEAVLLAGKFSICRRAFG